MIKPGCSLTVSKASDGSWQVTDETGEVVMTGLTNAEACLFAWNLVRMRGGDYAT